MGLYLFSHTTDYTDPCKVCQHTVQEMTKQPDPENYLVMRAQPLKQFLVVWLNYPNCTNYEGNKILVYLDADPVKLFNQKHIDPHFTEGTEFYSPVARFEPTERGWGMAVTFANVNTIWK